MEFWKSCKGFEGYYEVSSEGSVRSVERVLVFSDKKPDRLLKSRKLKHQLDERGYPRIRFCVNSKKSSHRVHTLVAEAFILNPENKPTVNHEDGNKTNNFVSNLTWATYQEQADHAVNNGLKAEMPFGKSAHLFTGSVSAYRGGSLLCTMSGNAEMAENGFDYRLVSAVLMGKRNTHKGCTFVKHAV